ncbi:metallophosphoesterase family protein [Oceanithermus sp.]
MRILHTADWHLGKMLKGVDRTPEIASALEDHLRIAREEKIDLVVVAGDLFDRPRVGAEAEAAAFEFFLGLRELGVPALVISGNHDSRARLEALAPLLELAGAHVRGEVRVRGEGGAVHREWGEAALLPFLSERRAIKAAQLLQDDEGQWQSGYSETVGRLIANLTAGFEPGQVNLLAAHLTIEGANLRLGGGEFTFYVGNSYAVAVEKLPPSATYVALGHIHRQQQVSDAPVAWYSGSLIQLDFGEGEDVERGVLVVELEPDRPPVVHPVNPDWGKPLRTFRLDPDQLDRRLAEVENWPGYAKLIISGPANSALREQLYQDNPHLLEVRFESEAPDPLAEAAARVETLSWPEAYERYLREERGLEEVKELLAAFRELYEEAHASA